MAPRRLGTFCFLFLEVWVFIRQVSHVTGNGRGQGGLGERRRWAARLLTPNALFSRTLAQEGKMPTQITGRFSCDNVFSIWTGNSTQVQTEVITVTAATSAAQIATGYDMPAIPVMPESYLYVIAFSDDGGLQGLIGNFSGVLNIGLDDPRWRVLPTKVNKDPGDAVTQAVINTALSAAVPTDWKVPFVGPANTPSSPWGFAVTGVPATSRWVWHNSGKDTSAGAPFKGFNHDEFLIFRIPCRELGIDFPPPIKPAFTPERPCKEYQYAVKVVSGVPKDGDGADIVAPGRYFTAINIHNPAVCKTVNFRYKVADAKPAGQPFGKISRFLPLALRPDQAVEIDNPQIFEALGREAAGSFVKGFAVIESPCELDVVAVYTTGSIGPVAGGVPAIHTERVAPRVIDACREDLRLNLSTGAANWQLRSAVALNGSTLPVGAPRAANVVENIERPASWLAQAGAKWISIRGNVTAEPKFPSGYFTFQTCFQLCAGFESASLTLNILADDSYVVWVNDTVVSNNPEPANFGGPARSITVPESAILPGRNCLSIVVRNNENQFVPNPVGLNVQASLIAPRGKCPDGCGCCSDHDEEVARPTIGTGGVVHPGEGEVLTS